MDLRKIKKLIELVEESDVRELEVRSGEESIRISRGEVGRDATPQPRADKVVSVPGVKVKSSLRRWREHFTVHPHQAKGRSSLRETRCR